MRLSIVMAFVFVCAATPAAAQTKGRVSVGVSSSFINTTDPDVDSAVTYGPVVRLNPRKGLGLAYGLNWFEADVSNPSGSAGEFARMRVRPVMLGGGYTFEAGRVKATLSVVGGPSFNRFRFHGSYVARPGESLEIDTSVAVRPALGVTVTVAPRVALIGTGGYVINRPNIVYRTASGQELHDRWKADAVVLSGGIVFSLF